MNLKSLDLFIENPDVSLRFYEDILGFREIEADSCQIELLLNRYNNRNISNVSVLKCQQFAINVFVANNLRKQTVNVYTKGVRHFCLQTSQSKSILNRVLENWDLVSIEPVPIVLGTGYKYAYGRDPEGNIIEAEEKIDDSGDLSYWIGHVSLTTSDVEKQITFYSKLLNESPLAKSVITNNRDMARIGGFEVGDITMAWFKTGGVGLELIEYRTPEAEPFERDPSSPGYKSFGFTVDDISLEHQRLIALGFNAPPIEGRGFSLTDPDGNLIHISEGE